MTSVDPTTDGLQTVIPEFIVDTIARALLPTLRGFYASPEGQKAFEEYKQQRSSNVLQNTYKGD